MKYKVKVTLLALVVAFATYAQTRDFWGELMAGNKRFASGRLAYLHLDLQREEHIDHQYPPVTVLSCADSRVPPELIFDQSIGEVFVIRVAGNVADTFPMASIEYAVDKKYTKLIVVMGHQNCGAVDAAIKGGKAPSDDLAALVGRIKSNIGITRDLTEAVKINARASAKALLKSDIIRGAVDRKELKIVPAYYSFETGKVTELAP